MNLLLKVYRNNQLVQRASTSKKKRFLKKARLINFDIEGVKVDLQVIYGKRLDAFNKVTIFDNEGEYYTKSDFKLAFDAFVEKGNI